LIGFCEWFYDGSLARGKGVSGWLVLVTYAKIPCDNISKGEEENQKF